jgi:hypothetical protein
MLAGSRRGVTISNDPGANLLVHLNISSMVFHHAALTAEPLVEIWRALLAEHCRAMPKLSPQGLVVAQNIAAEIQSQFQKLIEVRNRLVHASWHIGHWPPFDRDTSRVMVDKYTVNKGGLGKRHDLPVHFHELLDIAKQASHLWARLGRLFNSLRGLQSRSSMYS